MQLFMLNNQHITAQSYAKDFLQIFRKNFRSGTNVQTVQYAPKNNLNQVRQQNSWRKAL